jgi:hypothetical protein
MLSLVLDFAEVYGVEVNATDDRVVHCAEVDFAVFHVGG